MNDYYEDKLKSTMELIDCEIWLIKAVLFWPYYLVMWIWQIWTFGR